MTDAPPTPPPPLPPTPGPPGTLPSPAPTAVLDGLAVAALVLGILGILVVPAILAVIFGVIALRRIPHTGARGRGLAIAGIVLGGVWLVLIAIGIALPDNPSTTSGDRSPGEGISGPVAPNDLRVGDCVTEVPREGVIFTVDVGPCAQPHEGEVYAVSSLPEGPYPGDDEVRRHTEGTCQDALPAYIDAPPEDANYDVFFLSPSEQSWARGDRGIACLAFDPTGAPLTGSIKGRGPGP